MTDHSDYKEILSPNRYFDNTFDKEAIKLLPGEYFVTKRDMVLVTVLGSCVAACIRDRVAGIGGMNHFMLPNDENNNPVTSAARYGAYAMEMMINQMLKAGATRCNLEAKLFGGGNVLREFAVSNVGERNADFAQQYLESENIRVVAESLLDIYPRKIYFFPSTGKVMMKKLHYPNNDTIIKREAEYKSRLQNADIQGDVELF